MSNAALLFHPDAYDTSAPRLMGRQSAGASFLRGFVCHAEVDRLYLWNWGAAKLATAEALVRRLAPTDKPITWIGQRELGRLAEPGAVFCAAPANAIEAWNRRLFGSTRYSICGISHTTASAAAMDSIADLLTAPVEPWDTLICTSRAVRSAIETQLAMVFDSLAERFGRLDPPPVRLDTIPLGVNVAEFDPSAASRREWRARLGIPDQAVVVLYVGRFAPHAKMNPVPMALALEQAAQRSSRPVHWIFSGWAANEFLHDAFVGAAARHAPSVTAHEVDGRQEDVRFAIWSAADIFLSLSDNVQETFGLTPVEAMAAGLPSVISDWDGYRDLVRHEVEGFRVPTVMARPGLGNDLAYAHANGFESYDRYVGAASQFAAVDIVAAAEALAVLIDNDDLRARMGRAARERAETTFDWSQIIPQYQALWSDLGEVRRAAGGRGLGAYNPRRPDPFTLFSGYPTSLLLPSTRIGLAPSVGLAAAMAMLQDPTVSYCAKVLPTEAQLRLVFDLLRAVPDSSVEELVARFPPPQRGIVERGLVWLVKFGFAVVKSSLPTLDE